MNKLIVPAVIVATGMVAATAWSQAPTPPFQNKRYFTMPLEKDPTREVGLQSVTMPPGAGNQFHRHPGDQWTAVQEGEVTFTVKGKPLPETYMQSIRKQNLARDSNSDPRASAAFQRIRSVEIKNSELTITPKENPQ